MAEEKERKRHLLLTRCDGQSAYRQTYSTVAWDKALGTSKHTQSLNYWYRLSKSLRILDSSNLKAKLSPIWFSYPKEIKRG